MSTVNMPSQDNNSQESNRTVQLDSEYYSYGISLNGMVAVSEFIQDLLKYVPVKEQNSFRSRYTHIRKTHLLWLGELIDDNNSPEQGNRRTSKTNKRKSQQPTDEPGPSSDAGQSRKRQKSVNQNKITDVMLYLESMMNPILYVDYPEDTNNTTLEGIIEHLKLLETKYNHSQSRLLKDAIYIGKYLQMAFSEHHKGKKTAFSTFLEDNITIFSPSYSHFLMNLYELVIEFPRLDYCSVQIGYMQKNFKTIKEALKSGSQDVKDHWKSPPRQTPATK